MKPRARYGWDVPVEQALAIQRHLAGQVIRKWEGPPVRRVAGVDVGFPGERARAAVAVLSFPDLQLVDCALAEADEPFPYVPGLLAFREGPAILSAFDHLPTEPDLLIFDGHGLAHPRGVGIAAHMGVLLDVPSIGCAKSRLVGRHREPGPGRGDHVLLYGDGSAIGAVLRTREGVRPVYVSIGHRIDLERAMDFVLICCSKYRLPEPIRWAHRLASGEGDHRMRPAIAASKRPSGFAGPLP